MKFFARMRGDTMVEVLLGVTFFSIVCLGAYSLTNNSLVSTKASLNYNLVRNYMDSQANGLRFLQNSYVSAYNSGSTLGSSAQEWKNLRSNISSNSSTNVIDFGVGTRVCPTIPLNSFIVNPKQSSIVYANDGTSRFLNTASGISRIVFNDDDTVSNIYGMWIEARKPNSATDAYIDFYIRACWYEPGFKDASTIATIVRLYDI